MIETRRSTGPIGLCRNFYHAIYEVETRSSVCKNVGRQNDIKILLQAKYCISFQ